MTDESESEHRGAKPYAQAAGIYFNAGWTGILPLPARSKKAVPTGFTGHDGVDPGWPDIYGWITGPEGDGNIALRLPRHVIGIDVDNYDDKLGLSSYGSMLAEWGPLPTTWRSSSRSDSHSGIYLFSAPEGLVWPGAPGAGIEIIQFGHRYVVAWPSVHPEGGIYRWHDPDGAVVLNQVPHVDQLPSLPAQWVEGLTGGQLRGDVPKAGMVSEATHAWLDLYGGGQMVCSSMVRAIDRYVAEFADSGLSRHDIAMRATARVTRLIADGHTGGSAALISIKHAFDAALSKTVHRDGDIGEWDRLLEGAINLAAVGQVVQRDPCLPGKLTMTGQEIPREQRKPADPGTPADQQERSSWWPLPIDQLISGTDPEPPPRYLTRTDGGALLYAGKVNGIIGESESGKSFIALLAVAQALAAGENVTYVDFEDTGGSTIARLRLLGIPDDQMLKQFRYIGPQEGLDHLAKKDLGEHLALHRPALVVVDGFNAAMTLMGLDLNSNTDATKFSQDLLRPLTELGACTIYIDHLPKNNRENETKGGIGAQAKRAMTTGCTLKAEVVVQFGRGTSGKVKLTVDKDRPGHVRGALTGPMAGMFIVTASEDGTLALAIEAPPVGPFRPTGIMERISAFLADEPDGVSGNAIENEINGSREHIRLAIKLLLAEGYITQRKGARNATVSVHVKRFSDHLHLVDLATSPDLAASSPGRGAESDHLTSPGPSSLWDGRSRGGRTDGDGDDLDDESVRRVEFTREQLISQTAAYREALLAGGKPKHQADGSVIDARTGEVIWSP